MSAEMLKPTDIAEILGVTLPTIRRWIASNHIPHFKLSPGSGRNGCVRISAEDLQDWLQTHRHGPSHVKDGADEGLCLPVRHSPQTDRHADES